jgi:hypothetical protein
MRKAGTRSARAVSVLLAFVASVATAGECIPEPTPPLSLRVIPAGHYRLTDSGENFDPQGTVVLPGAVFSGPIFPAGETDGSALSGTFGFSLLSASSAGRTSGTLHTSLAIGATGDFGNYEKMGIYSRVVTVDGSIYGKKPSNRDAVGIESQCSFSAGIQSGRCWAYDAITNVPEGTDGYAVGQEILIANRGSDQPRINQRTTKIGLHLVSGGDASSTAGILLSASNGARWHDALVIKRSAVLDYAVVVRDDSADMLDPIASIAVTGDASFHDLALTGVFRRGAAQRDVPRSGDRVLISATTDTEILAPKTRIASASVWLPPSRPGVNMRILCVESIEHLTVSAEGAPVHGQSDIPCSPGRGHEFIYYPSDGWIQSY